MTRKTLAIAFLIIIGVSLRLKYFQVMGVVTSPDSLEYYELGNKILTNPSLSNIVNMYRTPLYPIFISGIFKLTSHLGEAFGSQLFYEIVFIVTWLQSIFALISLVFLYEILLLLKMPPKKALLLGIFLTLNINTIMWERALLTESFSISLMIITTFVLLSLMKRPDKLKSSFLLLLLVLGFLLRPSFITIPIASLPIILYFLRGQGVKMQIISVFLLFVVIVAGYWGFNKKLHGYNGISYIASVDLIGRILQNNISVDGGSERQYFYKNILDYRVRGGEPKPFLFLKTYDQNIFTNIPLMNKLQTFVWKVFWDEPGAFLISSIKDYPKAFREIDQLNKLPPPITKSLVFLNLLKDFYNFLRLPLLLVVPLYIFTIILFLKNPSNKIGSLLILGSIIFSQIVLILLIVPYGEYDRLLSPVQPHLFIFTFISLQEFLRFFKLCHLTRRLFYKL